MKLTIETLTFVKDFEKVFKLLSKSATLLVFLSQVEESLNDNQSSRA
jgi:hypothetical protein